MPASNSLAISKFLGKDRYEHYVQELTGYGTLGGTQLTPAQRRQAFVIRNNKIKFEKFVDSVLTKKTAAIKTKGATGTPGPKSGAIVKSPTGAVQKYMETQKGAMVAGGGKELTDVANGLGGILALFKEEQKNKKAGAEFDRRKRENERRKLLKNKLKKGFENLKGIAEKALAPVKSLLDRIIDFIMTIFIGRFVVKLLDWWGDKNNKSKVDSIIRFVKDWWPALLGSYILFGTSFGKLIRFVVGWAGKFVFQLAKVAIPKLLSIIGKNPIASAVILGSAAAGIGAYAASQQNQQRRDEFAKTDPSIVKPKQTAETGKTPGGNQLQQEQILQRGMGGMFRGGGLASLRNLFGFTGGGDAPNQGVPGYVSGEQGVDKVPAMLSDGEFVMSAGAVERYGVNTLEAMNAAGGGTNRPKIISGKTFAAGGGLIGSASDIIKKHEALSSLSPGRNDYVLPSSPDFKNVKSNTKIYPYRDNKGTPTIGWGSTYYDSLVKGSKEVKMTDPPIKKVDADNLLTKHLNELIPKAKSVLPFFDKMTAPQAGTIISFLYNAGSNAIDPNGGYPNFSKALIAGDMLTASKNNGRGGPSEARLKEESQSLLKGPKDLSKAPKQTEQKPQQNIFQKIQSGVSSIFNRPSTKSQGQQKYGRGGYAPDFAPMKPRSANITPLPRRNANMSSVQTMGVNGGSYGGKSGSPGGSTIPHFTASAGGSDRSNKIRTLGIGA